MAFNSSPKLFGVGFDPRHQSDSLMFSLLAEGHQILRQPQIKLGTVHLLDVALEA